VVPLGTDCCVQCVQVVHGRGRWGRGGRSGTHVPACCSAGGRGSSRRAFLGGSIRSARIPDLHGGTVGYWRASQKARGRGSLTMRSPPRSPGISAPSIRLRCEGRYRSSPVAGAQWSQRSASAPSSSSSVSQASIGRPAYTRNERPTASTRALLLVVPRGVCGSVGRRRRRIHPAARAVENPPREVIRSHRARRGRTQRSEADPGRNRCIESTLAACGCR
jgi:hypothetical protein